MCVRILCNFNSDATLCFRLNRKTKRKCLLETCEKEFVRSRTKHRLWIIGRSPTIVRATYARTFTRLTVSVSVTGFYFARKERKIERERWSERIIPVPFRSVFANIYFDRHRLRANFRKYQNTCSQRIHTGIVYVCMYRV